MIRLTWLGFLLVLTWQMAWAVPEKTLLFAPLPMENAQVSMAKSQRLTQFLTDALGRPVEPKFYSTYEAILQDLASGQLDFAELGPFNLYKLRMQTEGIKPLVFVRQYQNQQAYHCVLASAMDGAPNLVSFSQALNPNVLLTQPLSTCGWFASEFLFRRAGLDLNQYKHSYQGSHEGVALALLRKEALVGSLADFIAKRYEGLGLVTLEMTPPLPLFSIVASPQMAEEAQNHNLVEKLLNLRLEQTQGWGLGEYGFLAFDVGLQAQFEDMIQKMQPSLEMQHE
ncbi:MAG: PhnD/SsuA/transferrin family substrate-binding protein [Thiotrichales bacterium]|nr:PhnD/SsuA/transferrin family substrate-binding protein [Thiotrichales bacterium]